MMHRKHVVPASLVVRLLLWPAALCLLLSAAVRPQDRKHPKLDNWFTFEVLNTQDGLDLSAFTKPLAIAIYKNWLSDFPQDAMLGHEGKVIVRFEVQRDGKLRAGMPVIESTSGRKSLDKAAIQAIRDSAPFKFYPEAFQSDTIAIRFNFFYNMQRPANATPSTQ